MICDASLAGVRTEVRLDDFELRICPGCRSWIALPRPSPDLLAGYHDSETYFEHPYLELRRAAVAATDHRCERVFGRFREVAPGFRFQGARLLDVGCDTGNLLDSARRLYRVSPYGVDVALRPLKIASDRGIVVSHGPLEAAPSGFSQFDLMTAIDVVEHVAEPHALFGECARRLRPGGLLYIETPNVQSAIYGVGRTLWRATRGRPAEMFRRLFPSEHVEYYSRRGLEIVAARAGLRVAAIDTRPLPPGDIAVSRPLRAALGALQVADRAGSRHALWCAVFERMAPASRSHG